MLFPVALIGAVATGNHYCLLLAIVGCLVDMGRNKDNRMNSVFGIVITVMVFVIFMYGGGYIMNTAVKIQELFS